MKVLVAFASKYGSTAEIAGEVGRVLAESGLDVSVLPVEEVPTLNGYDVVVLGAAVYKGRLLWAAEDWVRQHSVALIARPVWLFSSGPVGGPNAPRMDPDVSGIMRASGARQHKSFGGKLARERTNFAERLVGRLMHINPGDYRDWAEIRAWASRLAEDLLRVPAAAGRW